MKIGTKSVLFGAHQFLLHPLFVALAWWQLFGFPWDPRLWVAFFVHDLGYWGKPNMDGPEGELHPLLGAKIMGALFDGEKPEYWRCPHPACDGTGTVMIEEIEMSDLCPVCAALNRNLSHWHDFTLYHSRFMARKHDRQFSRLCVADKLATVLVPAWLYLLLVNLTGEIHEYMDVATHKEGGKYGNEFRDLSSQQAWRASMCDYMRRWIAEHRDGRADTWTPRANESEVSA